MVLFRRLLGEVLRARRLEQGRSLRDLCSDASISLGYMSEIERGRKEASSELLSSICAALDAPLSEILSEVADAVAIEEARNIAEGKPVITKELADAIDGDVEFSRASLSPREQETLRLYASGFAQVQVARRMGIKQSAVKTNIDRIREKYARVGRPAPTKIDLRIRAIEDGLVEPTADITTAEKHL